jgi:hypothetical protein
MESKELQDEGTWQDYSCAGTLGRRLVRPLSAWMSDSSAPKTLMSALSSVYALSACTTDA